MHTFLIGPMLRSVSDHQISSLSDLISLKNKTYLDIMKITLSDGHSGGGKIMRLYILRNWSGAAKTTTNNPLQMLLKEFFHFK